MRVILLLFDALNMDQVLNLHTNFMDPTRLFGFCVTTVTWYDGLERVKDQSRLRLLPIL